MAAPSIDKSPRRIAGMFDAIARRYDLLNGLLSIGLDRMWRARAVEALKLPGGASAVDLCTGTADLAVELVKRGGATCVVGVDFAAEMLRHGQEKVRRTAAGRVHLVRGDAMQVPVASETADAVTIGFGIRNTQDPVQAMAEMYRVLRPGGRLAILEFGEPARQPFRALYRWYFRSVLPVVGRLVSRHDSAYAYLPESVSAFHTPSALRGMLADAGFRLVRGNALTLGVVYLYTATKPHAESPRAIVDVESI